MTEPSAGEPESWVPSDTFGARLALVRQAMGAWNIKKIAMHCGVDDSTWRNWEAGVTKPRDLEEVAHKIACATGVDYRWLMLGDALRSS